MTDTEIKEGLCRIQSRFNEIIYEFLGKSSDRIENLSDLKEQYVDETARIYKPSVSYGLGVICSLNNEIYISKENGNQGNRPDLTITKWKKVDVKNLTTGEYYVSALAYIKQDGYNTNDYDNFNIQSSWNVTSFENYGNGYFKLSFDPNAGLTDTNYLVMQSGHQARFTDPAAPNVPVFWEASVVQKTETYIIIKVPWDRYQQQFHIAIVPIQ